MISALRAAAFALLGLALAGAAPAVEPDWPMGIVGAEDVVVVPADDGGVVLTLAQGATSGFAVVGATVADGTIEVMVKSEIVPGAAPDVRGFAGLVFHVADDRKRFESFYLRPSNGRALEQIRRNHAVQYTSAPDYPWHRLREEAPGHYEAYADLKLGRWTKMRVELDGPTARLFVGDADQPTLIIDRTKVARGATGQVGLWIGVGTRAQFKDLKISPQS